MRTIGGWYITNKAIHRLYITLCIVKLGIWAQGCTAVDLLALHAILCRASRSSCNDPINLLQPSRLLKPMAITRNCESFLIV